MYNSIISTVVRDDEPYLDEWIQYHLKIGFQHIVIYDHKSIIPVVNQWGDTVTVIRKERESVTFPTLFHNETLKNFQSKWIAVLDVDEFIVVYQHNDINHLLSEYEEYGGLSIPWNVYGSSGHRERPEGLVKDNYLWRLPSDDPSEAPQTCNTIINTQFCTEIHNPHTCRSTRDIVNEDKEVCNTYRTLSSKTLCAVNHYITRSWEDWEHKLDRAARAGVSHIYSKSGFYLVNDFCTVYDDILKDYGEKKVWEKIIGWFNFNNLYTDMVGKYDDAVFVEIGAYKGQSVVFMADKIKNAGRNIKFYAVDVWEPFMLDGVLTETPTIDEFLSNIEPVKDFVIPIKGCSHDVASQFEDESIDFGFLDGNHTYEHLKKDIELWYPKIKKGGILAGHDYTWGGVARAVNETLDDIKLIPNTSCWLKNKI